MKKIVTCDHQFLTVSSIDRTPSGISVDGLTVTNPVYLRAIPGIIAGCIKCGEVRQLLENGELTLRSQGSL